MDGVTLATHHQMPKRKESHCFPLSDLPSTMQKAEARGEKARVALSLQKVDAGPDPLRPFPCLRLLPKTARANSIPVAAVAVVGKYSTRTIPAAEQSSTVALMEKNTVRETNGAYESWLFCLLLPLKKKGRGEDGTGT
jgi:hypothetical protein